MGGLFARRARAAGHVSPVEIRPIITLNGRRHVRMRDGHPPNREWAVVEIFGGWLEGEYSPSCICTRCKQGRITWK